MSPQVTPRAGQPSGSVPTKFLPQPKKEAECLNELGPEWKQGSLAHHNVGPILKLHTGLLSFLLRAT